MRWLLFFAWVLVAAAALSSALGGAGLLGAWFWLCGVLTGACFTLCVGYSQHILYQQQLSQKHKEAEQEIASLRELRKSITESLQ